MKNPTRWERDRVAALEALTAAGATAREARVLATEAAKLASALRLTSSWRAEADNIARAAALTLAQHRAAPQGATPPRRPAPARR